jgi:hypothetical protein
MVTEQEEPKSMSQKSKREYLELIYGWSKRAAKPAIHSAIPRYKALPIEMDARLAQPGVEVFGDEAGVGEVGIGVGDAVEFGGLSGAELFGGVETPDAGEEALAVEDFMDAGDAADEAIGRVENGGVGVGEFGSGGEQGAGEGGLPGGALALGEEFDGAAGPNGPLAQEAADDAALDHAVVGFEAKGGEEIGDDVVIVAGVEGNIIAAGFGDGADYVDGLIAIEGSNFYRENIFDLGESPPEFIGQEASADGRLQVKADDRGDIGDLAAVAEKFFLRRIAERAEAEQASLVLKFAPEFGLGEGLRGVSTDSGNAEGAAAGGGIEPGEFGGGERKNLLEHVALLSDRELGGMHAHGETTGPGRVIVTNERVLAAGIKPAIGGEREGSGGNNEAAEQKPAKR